MTRQAQCPPVSKTKEPRWMHSKLPKASSLRNFGNIPVWCRKPQSFTYHLRAEEITRGGLVSVLSAKEKDALLNRGEVPPDSSARGRVCIMCPVRLETRIPKIEPVLLVQQFAPCGTQLSTHIGRVCPRHVRILDPKRKIMVLSHPYMTWHQTENHLAGRDLSNRRSQSGASASRWCSATWINILVEKHAWLSTGLYGCQKPQIPVGRLSLLIVSQMSLSACPLSISLSENGSQQARAASARSFHFPMCFALICPWNFQPKAISLREAVKGVAND